MPGRVRLLLARLGFVLAGILTGHVLRWPFLFLILAMTGGSIFDSHWPGGGLGGVLAAIFLSFDIIFGLIGLWIGSRRIPGSDKALYPLAFVLILVLSYPVAFSVWYKVVNGKVRTTPEATARAHLEATARTHSRFHPTDSVLRVPDLTLGKRTTRSSGKEIQIEVKNGDTAVGYINVGQFMGFLWKFRGDSALDLHTARSNSSTVR